jgi:lipopolysaccharide biosynthesis glycosyltransferase
MVPTNVRYVTCSIDDNYFNHFFVLLTSLFDYNKHSYHIFILTQKLNNEQLSLIEDFFIKYSKNKYEVILVDETSLSQFVVLSGHIPISAYYRILLPILLPTYIDRILYLDVDIIIKGNISFFWQFDFDNTSHFAVEDFGIDLYHKRSLNIDDNLSYFNSGVIFINLDWWRKEKIYDKCLLYLQNNRHLVLFHDQDVLNAVLFGKWKELSFEYNSQESIYRKDLPLFRNKKYLKAYFNPIIIHYTGGGHSKPWHKECRHELKNEYAYYHYKSGMFTRPSWIRILGFDFELTTFTLPLFYFGRILHKLKRFY